VSILKGLACELSAGQAQGKGGVSSAQAHFEPGLCMQQGTRFIRADPLERAMFALEISTRGDARSEALLPNPTGSRGWALPISLGFPGASKWPYL
jgi:hypothetical protein